MSEQVVFSQLSRKFIDENDATPARRSRLSITAWRLVTTWGLSIAWRPRSPAHGMSIWRGSPPWKPVAMPA
ncbi:formate hydrogenlyase maturation protein [Salmonella enterica subsp. enterica]|uniref:Formate hydrogenlyase maturation protein n=1 Tax=Salmonella enterica I TaxID=59201 RepID=A0A447PA80_SALET|nr:formate hydrogenlyase maturation protein [Salmonella enterica subsp. enterica]